jgi:PEP-CTERM motif
LHFGVSDGDFADNTGFYTITVTGVPEPATWAMMLIGFAGLCFAGYRGTKKSHAAVA